MRLFTLDKSAGSPLGGEQKPGLLGPGWGYFLLWG